MLVPETHAPCPEVVPLVGDGSNTNGEIALEAVYDDSSTSEDESPTDSVEDARITLLGLFLAILRSGFNLRAGSIILLTIVMAIEMDLKL